MSSWFHGVKAIYAGLGSLAALTATVVGILVAVGVIGGDGGGGGGGSANQPPIVGGITLDPPVPVAGQTVRAQVSVTDPDRDQLVIQWSSDAGRFVGGDTGISVTFEPPANRGSFQLTAVISDRHNDSEQVSSSYVIDLPTPVPGAPGLPAVTRRPPAQPSAVEPLQSDLAPESAPPAAPAIPIVEPTKTPTPTPTAIPASPPISIPGELDISGRWEHETGYLEFTRLDAGLFEYTDFEDGVVIGEGIVESFEGGFLISGAEVVIDPFTGLPTKVPYTGALEIIDQSRLQAALFDQFGNFLGTQTFTR